MIYSIQLFSEKRTNRRDAFSAERQLVATVKCGELRANGRPIDYALLKTGNFRANVNFAKVFVLENNGKSCKWRQIEAKMV